MRIRWRWVPVFLLALALVAAALAWGWTERREREPFVLLTVVATSLNGARSGDAGGVIDDAEELAGSGVGDASGAPAGGAANGAGGSGPEAEEADEADEADEAEEAGLPWAARLAPLVVAVREESFVATVRTRIRAPLRLPAAVPVGGSRLQVLERRADGAVRVAARGRDLWLEPDRSRSVLLVAGDPPHWSDGDGDLWREALGQALARGLPLEVWRIANFGARPRDELPLVADGSWVPAAGGASQ